MDKKPFLLDKADAKKFVWIMGVGSWFMALNEFINPTIEVPTGRWSILFVPIYNNFGSNGLVLLWFLLGLYLIYAGLKEINSK
jgi:hypothetical protein